MAEDSSGDKHFNVDLALLESVIENKVKKLNVFSLNDQDNCIAFMVFFALGVHEGVRTPLGKVKGWVRTSSFRSNSFYVDNLALLDAVVLEELRKEGKENLITDRDLVYKIIEEYANTGIHIIDELIPSVSEYDADLVTYEMLDRISEEYNKLFPES